MKNWKQICLKQHQKIIDALKILTETGAKFSIVLDDKDCVIGSLTDGDIRRALLRGITVENFVISAMNVSPTLALESSTKSELISVMKAQDITHIPIVDQFGKLINIVSLKEIDNSESVKDNAVILMAGGLGSRLGDLTANCPKPMLKLGDKPILEIIIENLKQYGFHNFFLSVNYKSEIIESYFGDGSRHNISINYIRENERMGTAGSLSMFTPINELPVIVMNGDVLTKVNFSTLVDFHNTNKLDACMCTFRHDYQVPYGVVHFDNDLVVRIEEKPVQSTVVNAGIYSINPQLFSLIPKETFFDMPVLIERIINEKYRVGTYQVQDYWLDIGKRDDFDRAERDYKKINTYKA